MEEKLTNAAKLNQVKYLFDGSVNKVIISELKTIGIGNFIDGANWMREQLTQSVTKKSEQVWSEEDEDNLRFSERHFKTLLTNTHYDTFCNWLKSIKQRLGG